MKESKREITKGSPCRKWLKIPIVSTLLKIDCYANHSQLLVLMNNLTKPNGMGNRNFPASTPDIHKESPK